MGILTTNFGLYKPDPSEPVDVDLHINANLVIIDNELFNEFEYIPFTSFGGLGDPSVSKKKGYKWYVNRDNSIQYWDGVTNQQDAVAFVPQWTQVPSFSAGYTGIGGSLNKGDFPAYQLLSRGVQSDILLSGKVCRTDKTALPVNTEVVVATLPFGPKAPRKYLTYAGDAKSAGKYSMSRITVNPNGTISYYRMGAAQYDPGDLKGLNFYVCLDGIIFSTDGNG